MIGRLATRLFLVGLAGSVFTSATITFAAVKRVGPAPAVKRPVHAPKRTMRVPDVTGEAYVFAKGILEDSGFAWKVAGAEGFSVNIVSGQSPRAGTLVVDTGAPRVVVTLSRNAKYRELGTPENASPYAGTRVLRPGQKPKAKPVKAKVPVKAKRQVQAPPRKSQPAPTRAKNDSRYGAGKVAQVRAPDFRVAGAPSEPRDEMSLPARARLLGSWLNAHGRKTDANVKHWLFQHNWLVYGAKFGWWHGAEALETLIKVDQRVEKLWGIGADSEADARKALALVHRRSAK